MNVVLYMRYSSDKQTEQSIEGQERICTAYCQSHNMTIVGKYIDRALSASKHTEKRDEFQRMIRDCEKQTFEAVVVYKLDRFSRNRYDSAIYKNKLRKNGVRVVSATENISDSPEGIILEAVLEGMAEFYSEELSQKVSRGMHETALKCHSCGGNTPLGYKIENKQYVIDEATAPIVREAFTRYAAGETISQISKAFNERGYRTAKGATFNKNSFTNMFANERYIGVYRYKDIRIEGGMPAMVDKELFDKVQQRIKKNAQAPARGKATVDYLLSQKLFCGHCGSLMIGDSGTSLNGEKYYYYSCSKRKRFHDCDKKSVPKQLIEDIVFEKTVELITPEIIDMLADAAVRQAEKELQQNKVIPAIESEIKEIETSIGNLLKLAEKVPDSESVIKRLKELEDQKQAAVRRLDVEKSSIPTLHKEQVAWFLNEFIEGGAHDEHFRRKVFDMLINSVTIWDEPDGWKITIAYNLISNVPDTFRCQNVKDGGSSGLEDSGSPKKTNPNCFANRNRFGFVFCFQNKTISPQKQPDGCFCGDMLIVYTLNRNRTISPSCMTYSLPSLRSTPASRAADIEPYFFRSSNASTSARMKPRSISE